MKDTIEADNLAISINTTNITKVKKGVKQAKMALDAYREDLIFLRRNIPRVTSLSPGSRVWSDPTAEPGDLDILLRLYALIRSVSLNELNDQESQKKELEDRILHLKSLIPMLEREGYDREVELVLKQKSLALHLELYRVIETSLGDFKDPLSPIKLIPAEIWMDIFQIGEAMSIPECQGQGRRSLALNVSQVCKAWRNIAMEVPQLWTHINIAPVPWWPLKIVEGVEQLVSRSQGRTFNLIIVSRLERHWESQAMASNKIGKLYIHAEHGGYANDPISTFGTIRNSLFRHERYKPTYQPGYFGPSHRDLKRLPTTLFGHKYHIHFYGDLAYSFTPNRFATIPFRDPLRLTVETFHPTPSETLNKIISPFIRLHSLTLVNIWPSNPESLQDSLINLKYLNLSYRDLTAFSLQPFLVQGLEELHIQHTNSTTFNNLWRLFELPHLHTLGVTLHEHPLCSMFNLPALRTLTLYSSAPVTSLEPALRAMNSRNILQRVKNVSFSGWKLKNNPVPFEIIDRITGNHPLELRISNCVVISTDLIALVNQNLRIKIVTLDYSTGITQEDCEVLKGTVMRLNVHV